MTEDDSPRTGLAHGISIAAPYATTILVTLTATFYFSNYLYLTMYLKRFGIRPGVIAISLQDNIAQGFLLTVLPIVVISFILLISPSKIRLKRFTLDSRIIRTFQSLGILFSMLMTLLIGMGSSFLFANLQFSQTTHDVSQGCISRCYVYQTAKNSTIVGRLIVEDKDRSVVASSLGVYIIKNDDITLISPYVPPAKKPNVSASPAARPTE